MRCLVIKIVLLVTSCHGIPINDGTATKGTRDESDVVIDPDQDLSGLESKFYGFPKKYSGDLAAQWSETPLMNPEEMGEYAEGDIQMPPLMPRNGIRQEMWMWKNGTIPYLIDGKFKKEDREKVLEAISYFHLLTCIQFVPRIKENDYIVIKNGIRGCSSNIGRMGGRQEVDLESPMCIKVKGTILHELLHVIGFLHEQNRFERNDYVTVNYHNIRAGQENNFIKADASQADGRGVEYDYNSVMHYSAFAFTKNNQKTIEPKHKAVRIGQRKGLSRGDIKKVNTMYNCEKKEPEQGWNSAGVFVQ